MTDNEDKPTGGAVRRMFRSARLSLESGLNSVMVSGQGTVAKVDDLDRVVGGHVEGLQQQVDKVVASLETTKKEEPYLLYGGAGAASFLGSFARHGHLPSALLTLAVAEGLTYLWVSDNHLNVLDWGRNFASPHGLTNEQNIKNMVNSHARSAVDNATSWFK